MAPGWLRPAALVVVLWVLPLCLAVWTLLAGHTILGAVFAAWCLVGSRRVMPLLRQALGRQR